MSDTEQRFGLTMGGVDRDEPGLIRERDGTVWLVNPDGTRTQLPGAGGGLPAGGLTGEVLTKASNADGDADWEAGGGSLPNEWTIGEFGQLSINPEDWDNGVETLEVIGRNDQDAPVLRITGNDASPNAPVLRVERPGTVESDTGKLASFFWGGAEFLTIGQRGSGLLTINVLDDSTDGLRVKDPNGNTVFATSLGNGDVTLIDRIEVDSSGPGSLLHLNPRDGDDGNLITGNGWVAPFVEVVVYEVLKGGAISVAALGASTDPTASFGRYGVAGNVEAMEGGWLRIGRVTAPADGDLNAGQLGLWFDDTDGAGKLKIKAKTADGTVVSGQVALA